MIIPDPEGSSWELWAAAVAGYNPELSTQVSSTLPWQEFANRLTLVVPQAPRGDFFEDWLPWARALKQTVEP